MIRRSKPLARSRKPIPRKRAKPRRGPMRDRGYLQFLREESKCVACRLHCIGHGRRDGCVWCIDRSLGRCDPAHGPANGYGSKGPDNEALPLCRDHHEYQTHLGCMRFAANYGFDWLMEAAAHYKTYLIWKEAQA